MLSEIKDYLDSIRGEIVKRSDMLVALTNLENTFKEDILPNAKLIIAVIDNDKVVKKISKELNMGVKSVNEFKSYITGINKLLTRLISGYKGLVQKCNKIIITDEMDSKQVAVMETGKTVFEVVNYYSDYLLYITYIANNDNKFVYSIKKKFIKESIYSFNKIIARFKQVDIDEYFINISKLERVNVNSPEYLKNEFMVIGSKSFNYNPIYEFGKWWIDFKIWRINRLKENKRLLELKILEYKERQRNGDTNPELDKIIANYEEQVAKIDKKIEYWSS
jgi:hypothetical protein